MLANPFNDRPEKFGAKVAVLYGLLAAANIAAWVSAWKAFAGHPTLMGTAVLAYMFGLRHAFDADHIAAIDNVVRKLMTDRKLPLSSGFFFSLGHSTIVVLASIAVALAASMMKHRLEPLHEIGGMIGVSISATFLIAIGIANLFILRGIWTAFRRVRAGGELVEEDLDALLAGRGLIARIFQPIFGVVRRSWHLYPIGFLFGLGFDTATEIGVLGISASQAAEGLSFWSVLVFPALFTAGMSLMDATDSMMMTGAYGWAFVKPLRKLWYNMTITAASVVVALFVGGLEALGLIADKLGLEGGFWSFVGGLNGDLANFGYLVVGIFAASWLVSFIVYRVKRYDELLQA